MSFLQNLPVYNKNNFKSIQRCGGQHSGLVAMNKKPAVYLATDASKTAPPNGQIITSEKTSILIRHLERSLRVSSSPSLPSNNSNGSLSSDSSVMRLSSYHASPPMGTSNVLGKRPLGVHMQEASSSSMSSSAQLQAEMTVADANPRPRKQRRSNIDTSVDSGGSNYNDNDNRENASSSDT